MTNRAFPMKNVIFCDAQKTPTGYDDEVLVDEITVNLIMILAGPPGQDQRRRLGAAVASPSTGILWNDEMDDFSTPHHPNAFGIPPSPANFIRPGKRPMSSQSPLIIFDKTPGNRAKRVLAVGGAGGSTIISGVAGVALHSLLLNANVKQAVDAPRLHNQLYPNTTSYEPNFPQAYLTDLKNRGHIMKRVQNLTVVTAAERAVDGQLYANSDFRKGEESSPAGY
ncbi:Gamma-glutamyltranspeptidase [Trichostrongylus colubriformis]|uniref:Gamma-glutamyltranspeptidase n=1 Tax=Trichostrongylus colubriformis TaxID=6319 RepID=A0AAN8IWW7_TRICO